MLILRSCYITVQMDHGVGLFTIIDCNLVRVLLLFSLGTDVRFDSKFSCQDFQVAVLHIQIETSQISSSRLELNTTTYSFLAIKIYSCVWKDSDIGKFVEGGIVSALFEECKFLSISEDRPVSIEFNQAQLAIVRNSNI